MPIEKCQCDFTKIGCLYQTFILCDSEHYKLPAPQGHSSFITHLDWSRNSQYLVTNSGDYEILFCRSFLWSFQSAILTCWSRQRRWWNISSSGEASSGKHVTNMDTVRNLDWATSTCTLSFTTFGRWITLSTHLLFDYPKPVRSTR